MDQHDNNTAVPKPRSLADYHDELGPIPILSPPPVDEHGRPVRFTPEEIEYRNWTFDRQMKAISAAHQDPPGSDEEFLRAIDSHRPEGSKLFEGYY